MAPRGAALRRFFAYLEEYGGARVRLADLERALRPSDARIADSDGEPSEIDETIDALGRARVLRDAALATALPCGGTGEGCEREVRALPSSKDPDAPLRYVATCGARPRDCETADVDPAMLRQVSISVGDVARLARELLGAEQTLGATSPDPSVVVVGEQHGDGSPREILFLARPTDRALEAALDQRARLARRTLLLLSTARLATADRMANHGPGAHVEIDVLGDLFALRGGEIALARRMRLVRTHGAAAPREEEETSDEAAAPGKKAKLPPAARKMLPQVTSWSEVTLRLVDGETVAVRIGRRAYRLSYIDLGLGGESRAPIQAWRVLRSICENHGAFPIDDFLTMEAAKQPVSRLNKGLRAAFGLSERPIEFIGGKAMYRVRFHVVSKGLDSD